MERISVFDIFKIGVGPSSSHTMGPWIAALQFLEKLELGKLKSIHVKLYGSLAKTGRGHGTDIAVMLGLMGHHPTTIEVEKIDGYIASIYEANKLNVNGVQTVPFFPLENIAFIYEKLPFHPNALTFVAQYSNGKGIAETYYSIGGGFVIQEESKPTAHQSIELPYPIDREADIRRYVESTGLSIHEIVWKNELAWRAEAEIRTGLLKIWDTMLRCIYKGCHSDGELPGGLMVQRRARAINDKLLEGVEYTTIKGWMATIKISGSSFANVTKWVSCFA
ncbi:MAG: L-serine ammonia-lyase, iron-sulfur-dependent, subunit alpha, partial [Saprospiraceae bacterium]|nr:L-serine ammonia-lyase, iron-sulfur-dependent, subunit alpha [Saprospiraceae bacterium]